LQRTVPCTVYTGSEEVPRQVDGGNKGWKRRGKGNGKRRDERLNQKSKEKKIYKYERFREK
jgi:hypothetical protein